ncbi:MAG: hypothetical protein JWM21_2788 [Acidobacteria bacterium]|nr:hypothetical protein [Acidobacteriota bacterium]
MAIDKQRELDKQLAQKYGGFIDIWEPGGELVGLVGMDLRTYFAIGPLSSVYPEIIPHYTSDMFETLCLEKLVGRQGQREEYINVLNAEGGDLKTANAEQRCRALLKLGYRPPMPSEAPFFPPPLAEPVAVVKEALPQPELEPAPAPEPEVEPGPDAPQLPDDWWLKYAPDEHVPMAFQDIKGGTETIDVRWAWQDNLFEIVQTPLRVNGLSLGDYIEARWEEGDVTPLFARIHSKEEYGTIRVNVQKLRPKLRQHLIKSLVGLIGSYRLDGDVLALTYRGESEDVTEVLDHEDVDWEFADRLASDPTVV